MPSNWHCQCSQSAGVSEYCLSEKEFDISQLFENFFIWIEYFTLLIVSYYNNLIYSCFKISSFKLHIVLKSLYFFKTNSSKSHYLQYSIPDFTIVSCFIFDFWVYTYQWHLKYETWWKISFCWYLFIFPFKIWKKVQDFSKSFFNF